MGINYYLHRPFSNVCPHCGRGDSEDFNPPVHLGKSSAGWCFSLHIYPEGAEGVGVFSDLDGMKGWLSAEIARGSSIRDEYQLSLSFEQFLACVTERCWPGDWSLHQYIPNHSERGPRGLLRHRVDGVHCIAHGSGTWDCCVGDFS